MDRLTAQNAILTRIKSVEYPAVTYAPDGSAVAGDPVLPQSCLVNELRASFALDPRTGLRYQSRITSWTFSVVLRFQQEVCLDDLLNSLTLTPLSIPATANRPAALILLSTVNITHPPTGQSASGTQAILAFTLPMR